MHSFTKTEEMIVLNICYVFVRVFLCVLSDLVLEPFHDPGRGSGTVNQTHPQHAGGLGHLKEEVKQVFLPENHLDTGVCRKIYLCSLCKRHRTIGLRDVLCHKSNATFFYTRP